ncbi:hypothetical protein [Roseateles toxinivorans]|uniref:hypothetical protein n=1 Tax=Roseateles toxinivorans TaxID=270368 RepID=UPI00105BCD80|nr:hypothetical protein [Roseateles toxinivorans]
MADATISCDQEIARIRGVNGIRDDARTGTQLGLDWLQSVERQMRELCRGFDDCLATTQRAMNAGNHRFLDHPPAWALLTLQKGLTAGGLNLHGDHGIAVNFLQVVEHLISRWQHHPHFRGISYALIHEFPHAVAQFIACTYLADLGNPIGFNDAKLHRGQSPDMFINFGPTTQIGIEVKAPADLQWPRPMPDLARLERIIIKQLKRAAEQLSVDVGGIVVLGASVASPLLRTALEPLLIDLGRRKKVPSHIAGIGCVCTNPSATFAPRSAREFSLSSSADAFAVLNPRFPYPQVLTLSRQG